MIRFLLIGCCILAFSPLKATDSYNQGKKLAEKLALKSLDQSSVSSLPDYQGENVSERSYKDNPESLKNKATSLMSVQGIESSNPQHQAAGILTESFNERPQMEVSPSLIEGADDIVKDPLKVLNAEEEIILEEEEGQETIHKCQESAKAIEIQIETYLIKIPAKEFKQEYYQSYRRLDSYGRKNHSYSTTQVQSPYYKRWFAGGNWHIDAHYNDFKSYERDGYLYALTSQFEDSSEWRYLETKRYSTPIEEQSTFSVPEEGFEKDVWSQDEELDSLIDKTYCTYVSQECVEGEETRLVQGIPITRPCWKKKLVYECAYPYQNTCEPYRQKKCEQIDSICLEKIKDKCVLFEQTFACFEGGRKLQRTRLKGDVPYCLDGDCDSHGWALNQDFAEALSKLAIFNEMAKDKDENSLSVFQGESMECARHCINFTDCCKSFSGWGVSTGLSQCSEKEKALAQKREAGKCVFVGTYCAEKVLGVCIRKKSSFCCFSTKLSRLVHEQGRKQLGIRWGDAENPQCRALKIEELQQIDFSKIDLSELYQDLTSKVSLPDYEKATKGMMENIQNKVSELSQKDSLKEAPNLNLPMENRRDVVF